MEGEFINCFILVEVDNKYEAKTYVNMIKDYTKFCKN